ncbi:MAG: translation initiation factor IF-1 [Parcubacteria group bacterium]|nr:translation initiation factor IF-1 [Parcubacteria group bacterium]
MSTQKNNEEKGTVIEALPNALFKVVLANKQEMLAYLSGKMRMHRIKVMIGDTVTVLVDQYGGKGRITRRE